MLLFAAIFMTAFSVALEVGLVKRMPWLHRVFLNGVPIPFTGWRVPGFLINAAGSLVLSAQLGKWFGATGMVVLLAGMASTVISTYYYGLDDKVRAKWANLKSTGYKYHQPIKDTMAVFGAIVMIISFPFRVIRWCLLNYVIARNWVTTAKSKVMRTTATSKTPF